LADMSRHTEPQIIKAIFTKCLLVGLLNNI
jgi:hypothetical protein